MHHICLGTNHWNILLKIIPLFHEKSWFIIKIRKISFPSLPSNLIWGLFAHKFSSLSAHSGRLHSFSQHHIVMNEKGQFRTRNKTFYPWSMICVFWRPVPFCKCDNVIMKTLALDIGGYMYPSKVGEGWEQVRWRWMSEWRGKLEQQEQSKKQNGRLCRLHVRA